MRHTGPTFRGMLLSLAGFDPEQPQKDAPDLGVLPILADWLEEHGDDRASLIRPLRVEEYNDGGISFWYVHDGAWNGRLDSQPPQSHLTPDRAALDLANRVLLMFPERPRWRQEVFVRPESDHPDPPGFWLPRGEYPTPSGALATPSSGKLRAVGPLWPSELQLWQDEMVEAIARSQGLPARLIRPE